VKPRVKVIHIITGLNVGGAETMLYKLLSKVKADQFQSAVISLSDKGTLGPAIESLGIPVYTIDMRPPGIPRWDSWRRLKEALILFKPNVIQGWMYHGNLFSRLAGSMANVPVVWNVRQTLYDFSHEKLISRMVIWLNARLSHYPAKIIYNSHKAVVQHELFGFKSSKSLMVPNGFDCERFKPNLTARKQIRKELKISNETILIGHIARYHPMKNHTNFLCAAAKLCKRLPNVSFLLAGSDVDKSNAKLIEQIELLDIEKYVHLLGERSDMPALNASLDISVSSSSTEGFSNSIGEAMACGVPCVVTDVGDTPSVIGDTGIVVPPQDDNALAAGIESLLAMPLTERCTLGANARIRIETNYGLGAVVEQYEMLYEKLWQKEGEG
jgi:glycosyltransferase involved in cell wall biosynthesis